MAVCVRCLRLGRPGYYECHACKAHNETWRANCMVCGLVNDCSRCFRQAIIHHLSALPSAQPLKVRLAEVKRRKRAV